MKKLEDVYDTQQIINESMSVIFPQKGNVVDNMKTQRIQKVVSMLECGIADMQSMVSQSPAVVNQNYAMFDDLLNRLYSLIRDVEMLKQNAK